MIKVIKEIHPKSVILVKAGKFYHAYGKDSYILAYLFHYKIRNSDNNCATCGFPENAIYKIQSNLENRKINYLCVLSSHNYEIMEEMNYKNNNQYDLVFLKANQYMKLKKKADTVYDKLLQNLKNQKINEKINQIEEILNEI